MLFDHPVIHFHGPLGKSTKGLLITSVIHNASGYDEVSEFFPDQPAKQ